MCKEFRKAFAQHNDYSLLKMQLTLIVEEFKELLVAVDQMRPMEIPTRVDALKELTDLVYVCYQFAGNLDWDLDEAYRRVHESNMSKLVDGEMLKREDGKVLKGPNYQPPNLTDLV